MTDEKIPFNRPGLVGNEFEYLKKAIESGHVSGDGEYTKKCNSLLESALGVRKAFLTTSCTHALEMAAILLEIEEGDEVIVPSFTFATSVSAFTARGAKPIFVDIRRDTLNIDEKLLGNSVSAKTKSAVVVHYAGVGCEMDTIMDIAKSNDFHVVEDNAHGLFGKYKDRYLGTFGLFATQSFHETKNFSCGEGGAFLIDDESYIERAEIIREKGTDRSKFIRGQVDKYTWVDEGSSYLPSDILAAFLYAQLENRSLIQARRKKIWEYYRDNLEEWANTNGVILPYVPSECDQSYHMFYLIMPSNEDRTDMIARLKEQEILSVFHYLPLHLSPMGRKWGYSEGDFPITEEISDKLLRLPFFYSLTEEQQARVVRIITDR